MPLSTGSPAGASGRSAARVCGSNAPSSAPYTGNDTTIPHIRFPPPTVAAVARSCLTSGPTGSGPAPEHHTAECGYRRPQEPAQPLVDQQQAVHLVEVHVG